MLIPLALRVGRPRQLIHLAGWAAAVIVAFLYVFPLKSTFPNDFWQFWIVGRAHTFMALRDIYGPTDSVRIALEAKRRVDPAQSEFEKRMRESYTAVDVVSTPLLFTIYGRLSSENFLHDYDIYRYLCAVVYLAGLLAFASYLRFPSWTFPVLAWFYTMPFWPFRRDVIDGNNSALVAGTAMGALVVLARPRPSARVAAGVILGFLATF
ncbi:MAG: hypothetical protein JO102_06565, partial [Elusimicrobia bacterium]|nr:hypothetical protein [Elusimicrobiota bacterium]